ncbi:MAG: alanine--tRNA ligase [Anaerolineae bacterium]|nr:alanine--tRNA ligase [Anaerolineae bacterium]
MPQKKLTGAEIRDTFIDFFVEHGHTAVPSSSLVPGGDATLLFTNSGMVQFKDVFLGTDKRPYKRAVDSQKCMRVAGKHNDLDDVGRDDTHHTFFEMLGNWSFGDYYKKEAIEWAWQLLTDVWGLKKEHTWATVFKDDKGNIPSDEEAANHWRAQPGFQSDHVLYFGRKDNFWEMAETGPCGPCSEIHYDRGIKYCDKQHVEGHVCRVNGDCKRFLELWNLVFIQYNRLGPDSLEPLPATHVDTGMGFERIVSVLQDVDSNYKTDLFEKSLDVLRSLTGHSEKEMLADFTPYRVICDHTRSAAFLIADGVVPGNKERNYICRMIIRRAARFGRIKIGLTEPFLAKVAETVIETYGDFYPELTKSRTAILDNLTREEIRFARTLETGTNHLLTIVDDMIERGETVLDGRKAFELYATYGLPLEITQDILRERYLVVTEGNLPISIANMEQIKVDEAGFNAAKDEHSLASGSGKAMGKTGGEDAEFFAEIFRSLHAQGKLDEHGVQYDPYTSPRVEGELLALIINGKSVQSASFGDQVEVILPKTGFYIESGGQVNDTGFIRALSPAPLSQFGRGVGGEGGWEIEVTSMRRASAGVIVHIGEVISGQPKVGDRAIAEVDMTRRHDIMRNHTATHLLHAALHQVLGEHARQAGSLVAPDRLRFDFNHPEAMTPEQIERVERIVNDAVAADMEVFPHLKSREDAIAEGAMALFGEKYGDVVRTITISPVGFDTPTEVAVVHPMAAVEREQKYSYELCGGTHLDRTSDVGAFIIISEGSAAAGVRRIEAVTGRGAYDLIARRFKALKQVASTLKSSVDEVPRKVESLQDEVTDLKKELSASRAQAAFAAFDRQLADIVLVNGTNVLLIEVKNTKADTDALRSLADRFREKYPKNGVAVMVSDGSVISVVTEDLVKRGFKAGDLINAMGGRGGGRPNMAQGSLPDPSKVDEALEKAAKAVEEKLK